MFRLLPNLKDNEELTLTFEGEDAYIIKKTAGGLYGNSIKSSAYHS